MSYSRRLVTDGVTIMNKDLYDNLQDGIDELKQADENTQGEIKSITDSIEDGLANVMQDLFLLSEKVGGTKDSLQSDITDVSNKVAEVGGQLTEFSESITTQVGAKVDDIKTGITDTLIPKLNSLETNLASTNSKIEVINPELLTLEGNIESVKSLITNVNSDVQNLSNNLNNALVSLGVNDQISNIHITSLSKYHSFGLITIYLNGEQFITTLDDNLSSDIQVKGVGICYIMTNIPKQSPIRFLISKGITDYNVDITNYTYLVKNGVNINFIPNTGSITSTTYNGETCLRFPNSYSGQTTLHLGAINYDYSTFSKVYVRYYSNLSSTSYKTTFEFYQDSNRVSQIVYDFSSPTYKVYSADLRMLDSLSINFFFGGAYYYFTDFYFV